MTYSGDIKHAGFGCPQLYAYEILINARNFFHGQCIDSSLQIRQNHKKWPFTKECGSIYLSGNDNIWKTLHCVKFYFQHVCDNIQVETISEIKVTAEWYRFGLFYTT